MLVGRKSQLPSRRLLQSSATATSKLSEGVASDPLHAVANEWLRRVEAEYHSAAAAQHYTLWLIQAGASPDLIRDGLRIVDDELVHAELSHHVYRTAGGSEPPSLRQEALGLERQSENLHEDLLLVGVSFFCLGETIAVPLFQRMRKGCANETARVALDRILVDEVRHRDFGWTLLDWLLELKPELRPILQERLADLFVPLCNNYGADGSSSSSSSSSSSEVSTEEREWGLIEQSEYAEILERCIVRDYKPRFNRCGLTLPDSLEIPA